MKPQDFLKKWRNVELKERSASQSHFNDLCALLGILDPVSADPKGEWFTFEKGANKTSGGNGWADVWRRECFGWEYKGRHANLDKAYAQLLQYSVALENPPLLIVSDMNRIVIRTNWTNSVQETHEIALDDLTDGAVRDRLKAAFLDPEQFRPAKSRQELTEETAREFAGIAQRLRDRGHEPHRVAHFVNQLVFCMFAEDVGLLPDNLFTKMLTASRVRPERFEGNAAKLFGAMAEGGDIDFTPIDWFNGGLFTDASVLPVESEDIDQLLAAARRDWSQIDPSILGTLFERGLDPAKRSQLGAHYTDRDKIMMIIRPVIIEPLEAEWAEALAKMTALVENAPKRTAEKLLKPAERGRATRMLAEAAAIHSAFIERLANFRVLDPACGSGNFLYVALKALKDIEHRANLDAEALGLPRGFPRVGPECMLGIELNPYAAELARVSVWIGEIQWMRRNGFEAAKNPILRPLDTIECRDALVFFDEGRNEWQEARWPIATVIVGNPPFLGGKSMKRTMGEDATRVIRDVYSGRISAFSDLVCYWFEKSRSMLAEGIVSRSGFVSTKAIAKNVNLPVLQKLAEDANIYEAWQNEPWVVDGAAVRVSLVCFAQKDEPTPCLRLNGREVEQINPNLTSGQDTSSVAKLRENANSVFIGVQQSGPLSVDRAQAIDWLIAPLNPNGKPNSDVVSAYASTEDIVGRPTEEFLIDFPKGLSESEASEFEAPFEHLRKAVYDPHRDGELVNFPEYRKATVGQNPKWWEAHRSREGMRAALKTVDSYLATAETTEYRLFRFLSASLIPDKSLYAFPHAGLTGFGVLQSTFHEVWCTYFGNRIGAGNQRRYNASFVYLTFPFPEGLTPNIPAADYADDRRALAIAAAAARLNELRENWLNPADLVVREREVVPGYPDRILPRDEAAAKELKKRTLTNLYNVRPQWLANAHAALDAAVADAYGWGDDWRAGRLDDDEILARLFALNQSRSTETS
ncbi:MULTISPECIES: class I SAM-dependent DNA methyltransferase [Sphingobium]|uniref:site-specific DNA-methyltransferase (adenine-specific) n=1 Tax=Sphingobium fuliginis (strain ATCC 27551) TaxID=336203 RepID=A0ABQ1ESD6_SPHSA|nr:MULTISPECIES: DNA methyltransferase [Sphingobium]RYL99342.1 class I SAM-dependent DNA methyltransferase [Sphingobium fuliginis]WDA36836.1 class I SAM-dependent DNA methyltransferase [Sphingobium sp. YC-XJ3]GFZ84141.1 DNA methyltransferase yeeA [Sphingobium fuliginis]